jgi:hypothetical protein
MGVLGMEIVTTAWVESQRELQYHRTPERRVHTLDEAKAFLSEVGFCHLWPIQDIEMPSLFHAIAGRLRPVPRAHDDADLSACWGWKDDSLGKRWWYYGKMLRRKATLISIDMLPFFYACTENYGDLDDYLQEYQAGTLSSEAKQIYEALLRHGPLDTIRLRRESWMSAQSSKSRFERALVELQVGLKVLPTGVAEAGAWDYAFIYDIVQRHFPDLPGQARQIKRSEARRTLVLRYLHNTVGVDRDMIRRVFHVLNWTPTELERTLASLLQEGAIRVVQVEGRKQPQLISSRALECGLLA